MATSSITKNFTIKGKKNVELFGEALIKALKLENSTKYSNKRITSERKKVNALKDKFYGSI